MTTLAELQAELKADGRYHGQVDGQYGALTRAAILTGLSDGPATPLFQSDYEASAARLACPVAHIMAIAQVEAAGAGFFAGRPKLLFEPHCFHSLTGGRFDISDPAISYPRWGTRPYPPTQDARYDQLLEAVGLDVDAGFSAASYGKFQILGENHQVCGYARAHRFAFAMARDEKTQLRAFEMFVVSQGIVADLRAGNWSAVARTYNGTAFALNRYDQKLATAAASIAAQLNTPRAA